ncbi:MAG TPA: protein kinase [Ktedonobacterales bacterium]
MWPSLEGRFIGGRYEIGRHIATGGMATVYQGWDHRVERPVAIKVLCQLDETDPDAVARFKREAHATAVLNHPNVVRAYDFFAEHEYHYLIMEYVDGINLKQYLRWHGPIAPPAALHIAQQVCAALQAAHAHEFIHRDVKPQNILLDRRGTAKVTDFGIVHITHGPTLTSDGIVLGTADYVAPEQARGESLTPATDVYALGVVLYEMLTGRLPFTGPTPIAVATLHATAPVKPPSRVIPGLSPYVEAVVMRAMRKHPEHRYASAAAMTLAIRSARQALALRTVAAAPPARPALTQTARVPVGAGVGGPPDAPPAPPAEQASGEMGQRSVASPPGTSPTASDERARGRGASESESLGAEVAAVVEARVRATAARPEVAADPSVDLGPDEPRRAAAPVWVRVLVVTLSAVVLLAALLLFQVLTSGAGGIGMP